MFLVIELHRIAKNVGNFSFSSIFTISNIYYIFFNYFHYSSLRRFKLKSIWKERKV